MALVGVHFIVSVKVYAKASVVRSAVFFNLRTAIEISIEVGHE
jgi:hypothetical protein